MMSARVYSSPAKASEGEGVSVGGGGADDRPRVQVQHQGRVLCTAPPPTCVLLTDEVGARGQVLVQHRAQPLHLHAVPVTEPGRQRGSHDSTQVGRQQTRRTGKALGKQTEQLALARPWTSVLYLRMVERLAKLRLKGLQRGAAQMVKKGLVTLVQDQVLAQQVQPPPLCP